MKKIYPQVNNGTIMRGDNKTILMIEKIQVNNQDVWLLIEPQDAQHGDPNIIPTEYFIVSYSLKEPASVHEAGNIFNDTNGEPKHFYSPVEAVEYAVEKLPVILG